MQITFYGFSCFKLETGGQTIYFDPYLKFIHKIESLAKPDLIIFSHGHFDHGALMLKTTYKHWLCPIIGPSQLIKWMKRKYKRLIPMENFTAIDNGESLDFKGCQILATPTYHPLNRLGKTIFALHTRSRSPGNPVNGYYVNGFYFSGDTKYTPEIAKSLRGREVKVAAIPIGGKYGVANPSEACDVAGEIKAKALIPMHYHALIQQVPFRYQPSHLIKLANTQNLKFKIHPLAIGESLDVDD